MKPELKWDLQKESSVLIGERKAELEVILHSPYVETRIVKVKPHTLDGSSMIADRAIQKFLHKSFNEVSWSYGDRDGDFQITLKLGSKPLRRESFEGISKFIYEFDTFVKDEIRKLINPR